MPAGNYLHLILGNDENTGRDSRRSETIIAGKFSRNCVRHYSFKDLPARNTKGMRSGKLLNGKRMAIPIIKTCLRG